MDRAVPEARCPVVAPVGARVAPVGRAVREEAPVEPAGPRPTATRPVDPDRVTATRRAAQAPRVSSSSRTPLQAPRAESAGATAHRSTFSSGTTRIRVVPEVLVGVCRFGCGRWGRGRGRAGGHLAAIPPPGVGRMTLPRCGVNWLRMRAAHYTPRSKGTDPAITGEPPEEPDPGAPAPSALSRAGRDSPSQLETKRSCEPSPSGRAARQARWYRGAAPAGHQARPGAVVVLVGPRAPARGGRNE